MPYMVVSNTFIKEICVLREEPGYCIVCYKDPDGQNAGAAGFRIRRNRIYKTVEEAEEHTGNLELVRKLQREARMKQKTHHDYEMEQYEEMIRRGRNRRYR